jgi:hypothetical protein
MIVSGNMIRTEALFCFTRGQRDIALQSGPIWNLRMRNPGSRLKIAKTELVGTTSTYAAFTSRNQQEPEQLLNVPNFRSSKLFPFSQKNCGNYRRLQTF